MLTKRLNSTVSTFFPHLNDDFWHFLTIWAFFGSTELWQKISKKFSKFNGLSTFQNILRKDPKSTKAKLLVSIVYPYTHWKHWVFCLSQNFFHTFATAIFDGINTPWHGLLPARRSPCICSRWWRYPRVPWGTLSLPLGRLSSAYRCKMCDVNSRG